MPVIMEQVNDRCDMLERETRVLYASLFDLGQRLERIEKFLGNIGETDINDGTFVDDAFATEHSLV